MTIDDLYRLVIQDRQVIVIYNRASFDSSTDEFDGPSSHNIECWENVRLRPLTILYRLVIYDRQMNASYDRASIDLYEMDRVAIKKEYETMLDRL